MMAQTNRTEASSVYKWTLRSFHHLIRYVVVPVWRSHCSSTLFSITWLFVDPSKLTFPFHSLCLSVFSSHRIASWQMSILLICVYPFYEPIKSYGSIKYWLYLTLSGCVFVFIWFIASLKKYSIQFTRITHLNLPEKRSNPHTVNFNHSYLSRISYISLSLKPYIHIFSFTHCKQIDGGEGKGFSVIFRWMCDLNVSIHISVHKILLWLGDIKSNNQHACFHRTTGTNSQNI